MNKTSVCNDCGDCTKFPSVKDARQRTQLQVIEILIEPEATREEKNDAIESFIAPEFATIYDKVGMRCPKAIARNIQAIATGECLNMVAR